MTMVNGTFCRKDHTVDSCILCGRNRRASIPGTESTQLDSLKFCECPQPDDCAECKVEDEKNLDFTKEQNPLRLRLVYSDKHLHDNKALVS